MVRTRRRRMRSSLGQTEAEEFLQDVKKKKENGGKGTG